MCPEMKDLVVAKSPENLFGALKTGQNLKSYIFPKTSISEINVQLFENFWNLIALQVWSLASKNFFYALQMEPLLSKMALIVLGAKICKNL